MMLKFQILGNYWGRDVFFFSKEVDCLIGHKLRVIRDHLATARGDPVFRMKPEPRKANNTNREY